MNVNVATNSLRVIYMLYSGNIPVNLYSLAGLHCQYKKYKHKRPKHILL